MNEFVATAEQQGMRADLFLAQASGLTRSRVANLMEQGHVQCQGRPVRAKDKVKAGMQFTLTMPAVQPVALMAQDLPLCIVYQDADIAVINKQRGLSVHPGAGINDGTLVNALLYHLDHLSGINGELRPGIVHRLDKDTTGLLLVAKNDMAHQALSQQIQDRTVKREYLALVAGNFSEEEGLVDAPIGRHKHDRKRMAVVPDGRPARTHWRVMHRFGDTTLVLCTLETGRTHQIRVHMAHIAHPVLQDPVYGPKKDRERATGQLLHAWRITFAHPCTGRVMSFTADPPADYLSVLKRHGFCWPEDFMLYKSDTTLYTEPAHERSL